MNKIDELAKAAAGLPEEHLDGLIDYARTLAAEPFYYSAPAEAKDAIERGLSEYRSGASVPASGALERLQQRVRAALPKE